MGWKYSISIHLQGRYLYLSRFDIDQRRARCHESDEFVFEHFTSKGEQERKQSKSVSSIDKNSSTHACANPNDPIVVSNCLCLDIILFSFRTNSIGTGSVHRNRIDAFIEDLRSFFYLTDHSLFNSFAHRDRKTRFSLPPKDSLISLRWFSLKKTVFTNTPRHVLFLETDRFS